MNVITTFQCCRSSLSSLSIFLNGLMSLPITPAKKLYLTLLSEPCVLPWSWLFFRLNTITLLLKENFHNYTLNSKLSHTKFHFPNKRIISHFHIFRSFITSTSDLLTVPEIPCLVCNFNFTTRLIATQKSYVFGAS